MDATSSLAGLALIVFGYLAGAIPWGVVLGRLLTGVDLRGHGSGSIGTTNALRVYGWKISVAVLVLDLAKGALPVVIGRVFDLPPWAVAFAAVAATVGHCWSIFIKGGGGKGVATGGAAVVAMTPWALAVVPILIIVVLVTRYVSLGSILMAAIAPPFLVILALFGQVSWWTVLATAIIAAIIIHKHRGNIDRLRSGTERKFGQRSSTSESSYQAANA